MKLALVLEYMNEIRKTKKALRETCSISSGYTPLI